MYIIENKNPLPVSLI